MDLQISKKQFIILTILIIAITAVALTIVIKKKNNNDLVVNESNNITQTENKKETIIKNDNEKNQSSTDNNKIEGNLQEENKIEEEISTTTKGEKLTNVVEKLEQSNIFKEMIEPTKDEIDDFMDIDVSLLDEYVIKMSNSRFESDLYLILKPSENNEETVMNQVKSFLINYENSWVNLDYKQYDLISNRKAIKRNGYLIYVISNNNDEFLNIVRSII